MLTKAKGLFKDQLKEKSTWGFMAFAIILIICRYVSMFYIPDIYNDVILDESRIVDHITSIITNGTDTYGAKWPLYSHVGDGYVTYAFLYPMALLCAIFGSGVMNARAIIQTLTIISCILTASGVKIWTNNKRLFWYTLIIALSIPWGFVQGNRIWDPTFVPLYFSIVFYFWCRLLKTDYSTKLRLLYEVLVYGGLVFVAVIYPPNRIPAVAMWIFLLIWGLKENKVYKKDVIFIVVVSAIFSLPLAYYLFFDDEFNSRAALYLVFQGESLKEEIVTYFKNLFDLFSPTYLFITGDQIDRHSLPRWGLLGTINVVAAIVLIRKKYDKMDKFLLYTIFWTFASTALTNEYQPHTLRACLVWMPASILLAEAWDIFLKDRSKKKKAFWYICFIGFFIVYFGSFIRYYGYLCTIR